jgi:hypothetical protein
MADIVEKERDLVQADRADAGDLSTALLALKGIFEALDAIVDEGVVDELWPERRRDDAVGGLILAGKLLAEEVLNRY